MPAATLERRNTNITEASPQKKESIFEYYSVQNEIDFLRTIDRTKVTKNDARFYIEENVFRFLGEFAGKVPYTHISYLQNGGGPLTYGGIDLTDSYKKTAAIGDDREKDEFVGYDRIQRGFADGATTATWISPPKIADYGFVFHFARDKKVPRRIKEYILRYDERRGEVANSQSILAHIDPTQSHETDRGFLQNPVVESSSHDPQDNLNYVMRAAGIDEVRIRKSTLFESRARRELSQWVAQYTKEVFGGNVEKAELILTAAYNKALEIAGEIDSPADATGPVQFIQDRTPSLDAFIAQYGKKSATVTGGGSCPVTRNKGADPLNPKNVVDALTSGRSLNKIIEENEPFLCPSCDKQSPNPLPRTSDEKKEPYCPHCNITMSQAADKGYATC